MAIVPTAGGPKISGFRGTNSRLSSTTVDDPWGLLSLNCEYEKDEVKTRLGTYALDAATLDGFQRALAWKSPEGGTIVLLNRRSGTSRQVLLGGTNFVNTTPVSTSSWAYGMMEFLPWGNRVYLAENRLPGLTGSFIDYPTYIHNPAGSPLVFKAFHPPLRGSECSVGLASGASGNVTLGTHYFAVAFETLSGHITHPSPVTYSIVSGITQTKLGPSAITINNPNEKITVTVNRAGSLATWPTEYAYAHLMVTTASNSSRWFRAPIAPVTVPAGTATAIVFELTDSDAIIAQGTDWTFLLSRWFNLSAYPLGIGVNQFPPIRTMFPAGTRAGWVISSKDSSGIITPPPGAGVYFSDPGQPEAMTPQYHLVTLPGGLDVTTGCELESKIFLLGPDWTFTTVDTGGYPVTWPSPTSISSTIGVSHTNAISINPHKYALVGHESGLYVLRANGYDDRPLSWNQKAEWEKITWPSNGTNTAIPPFHIVEDAEARLIFVQCLTTDYPNGCLYVWDYSEGLRWDRVKFSIWTFTGGVGAIALPHNFGDAESSQVRQQLAIYPFASGKASLRKRPGSASPSVDAQGERIDSQYKTAYLGQTPNNQVHQFTGLAIDADGVGALRITAYGLDDTPVKALRDTTIATTGRKFERIFRLKSEGCAFLFRNGPNAGDRFRITTSASKPSEVYSIPYGWRRRD